VNTYLITNINKDHKLQHIRTILHNNNYPTYKQQTKPHGTNASPKNDKNGLHIHVSEYKQDLSQDYLNIQIYEHHLKPEMRQKTIYIGKSIIISIVAINFI
jgi:hypothetical protein